MSEEMSADVQKVDLGGYALRARTLGAGERAFVLVHGFADGMDVWDGIAPALARRGRLVLLEQRGHGFSGGPEGPYDWDDLAKDLLRVTEQLQVGPAVWIGHGLGGLLCLLAALQAPERALRLVVIGTATEMDAGQQNWCREVVKAGRMNALEGIAHAIYGPISRKQVDGIAGPLIELARCMETLRDHPLTARVAAVTAPTLVLTGENDPARCAELSRALPNATLETIAGQGHFPHKRDPAAVVAAIERFVGA